MTRKWVIDYPMRTYIIDEMSKFKNPYDTRSFLCTLDRKKQKTLMKWLSSWRKNMVYERIIKTNEWELRKAPISSIVIGGINKNVEPIISFCDYNLGKIARLNGDSVKRLKKLGFGDQGEIKTKILLARKEYPVYKIIDGAHRAVRLVWDGVRELELLVIKPIITTLWQRIKIRLYNMFHDDKLCPKCGGNTLVSLRPYELRDSCLNCDMDW